MAAILSRRRHCGAIGNPADTNSAATSSPKAATHCCADAVISAMLHPSHRRSTIVARRPFACIIEELAQVTRRGRGGIAALGRIRYFEGIEMVANNGLSKE